MKTYNDTHTNERLGIADVFKTLGQIPVIKFLQKGSHNITHLLERFGTSENINEK